MGRADGWLLASDSDSDSDVKLSSGTWMGVLARVLSELLEGILGAEDGALGWMDQYLSSLV